MEPQVLPATLDSLAAIRAYAQSAAAAAGLDDDANYKLQLAVDEIATNIIVYGYAGREEPGEIALRADMTDDALSLTLEDTGQTFDPRVAGMPGDAQLASPLDERREGGLGIFLALRSVDGFRYEHEGGLNRTVFVMRRPASS